MRQQLNPLDGILARADDWLGLARQRRNLIEMLVNVEVGILFFRDQQRAARQWHRLLRRKRRKFAPCIVHAGTTVRNSVALRRRFDKHPRSVCSFCFERRLRLSANGGVAVAELTFESSTPQASPDLSK